MFTLVGDSLINLNEFKLKQGIILNITSKSFGDFFKNNPNTILFYNKISNGNIIYFGRVIDSRFLDLMAESIKADVALVIDDLPIEISYSGKNQRHLLSIVNAAQNLKFKNNFDLFTEELENADFTAAYYTPRQLLTPGGKISFIVFNTFPEAVDFRNTLKTVMFLIVFAGSAITFIFIFLFTTKLRKQISLLNQAVEITGKGNLEHTVDIITKDEIGKLGEVFNKMLAELKHKEEVEKEYSEFITLINQNPTLNEISEASLSKIIKSTRLTFGVLYLVENKELRLISSHGISKNLLLNDRNQDFYSNAVDKKEMVEFHFHENFPEIKTGLALIKIKYLLIYPIIFNKETIAILELASETIPVEDIKPYIDSIKEQLAIGLMNAKSFEQLENLVEQLRALNIEYQKQNKQITEQNLQLKELHNQLIEKAEELERQRTKALELTSAKSEFLASMSHELRTPLISILGLTELMLKDPGFKQRSKDKLNIVYRNGKKLLSLITNILEFSRFETGKIEIRNDTFLLSDFLEELKPNIEYLSSEKELNFVIDLDFKNDLLINTDKDKLEHILNNLLVNSIKYTPEGEVKLVIKIKDLNSLEFKIIDTGIGISQEHQKIIFSEFQQINTEGIQNKSGVGLGLAICKRYVELLGSSINVESKVNNGSVFSFVLNNVVLEVLDELPDKLVKTKDKELFLSRPNIVIIGGDISTNKLMRDYLNSYEYNVSEYPEWNDEINILLKSNLSAIILANKPNDISPWNIIIKIKSEPEFEQIPIIVSSIISEEKVGLIPNIFDYLIKPFDKESVLKVLTQIDNFTKTNIKEVFLVSLQKDDYITLKNFIHEHINITYYTTPEKAFNDVEDKEPDLMIVDVEDYGAQLLYLCTTLKQRRLTKNIYIVFSFSKDIDIEKTKILSETLYKITLREKYHPLDVLKDIKERLAIDDEKANKRFNLMESISEKVEGVDYNNGTTLNERTVLIVDDDDDSLFTIGELIKETGMKTLYAHNGMECLLTLNHVEPDVILLDIMMPTMDGFETIKKIRSDKRVSHIPVLALTAYAMLDNKTVIEKNGFDDLITKPIDSKSLISKLYKFIKTA